MRLDRLRIQNFKSIRDMEIQDIENVSTHSVGRDENRKIVVCYEGADKIERRRRGPRPEKQEEA